MANSWFYAAANSGTLFPDWSVQLGGVDVTLVVLGDAAYPLLPWLMKPYLDNPGTTDQERYYNYRQSRARMVVENAFGRLKGRWRCLLRRMAADVSNAPSIVGARVVHQQHM